MDITYGVSKLFELAFGVTSPIFIPYPLTISAKNEVAYTEQTAIEGSGINYPSNPLKAVEASDRLSWMGTPVVMPWALKGGFYKVFDNWGNLIDTTMEDFEMPAATLVDFEREKILSRTRLSSGKSTVKEMYGFDDWDGRVRGICLTDYSRKTCKTATEQKQMLLRWESVCNSINVVGDLFFEKDIMAFAMSRIRFQQLEGKPDVIPFEFQIYSDEREELIL